MAIHADSYKSLINWFLLKDWKESNGKYYSQPDNPKHIIEAVIAKSIFIPDIECQGDLFLIDNEYFIKVKVNGITEIRKVDYIQDDLPFPVPIPVMSSDEILMESLDGTVQILKR